MLFCLCTVTSLQVSICHLLRKSQTNLKSVQKGLKCKVNWSDQTFFFLYPRLSTIYLFRLTDWAASYIAGISRFTTNRDSWRARARVPNTASLPWKLFRKTLQPLLKDGVGVERSVFSGSTALSMLWCLLLSCRRPHSPPVTEANKRNVALPGWQQCIHQAAVSSWHSTKQNVLCSQAFDPSYVVCQSFHLVPFKSCLCVTCI